jgi:ATP-dependent Clp protease ATP-binding subunit ClpX
MPPKKPAPPESRRCSFCNRNETEIRRLITGPEGAFICNECVELCRDILEGEEPRAEGLGLAAVGRPALSPHEIYAKLDEYVVGQEHAKRVLSVAVYNHYKRIANRGAATVELEKSNILLVGPTGCGKTLLAQTLARTLDVPFCIADATALTEAGYVGEDVENILLRLLQVNVPPQGGRKHPQQEFIQVNTTNVLFICGGTFDGLAGIISERVGRRGRLGFPGSVTQAEARQPSEASLLRHMTPDDLMRYGMIPELVGRLPVVSSVEPLDLRALRAILTEPRNALVRQYRRLFEMDQVDLTFTPEALEATAQKAFERETGARGLRSIIEGALLDVMYEIPSHPEIRRVVVGAEVIEAQRQPQLLDAQGHLLTFGDEQQLPDAA